MARTEGPCSQENAAAVWGEVKAAEAKVEVLKGTEAMEAVARALAMTEMAVEAVVKAPVVAATAAAAAEMGPAEVVMGPAEEARATAEMVTAVQAAATAMVVAPSAAMGWCRT